MAVDAPVDAIFQRREQQLLGGLVEIRQVVDDQRAFAGALERPGRDLAVRFAAAELFLGIAFGQRSRRDADERLGRPISTP